MNQSLFKISNTDWKRYIEKPFNTDTEDNLFDQ